MSEADVAELACTYAALILHDDKVAITADKLTALIKAANVEIPPFWTSIFARVLAGKNLDDLILNGGGGAPAAVAAAPAPAEDKKGKKEEAKKEEKKKEKEPEPAEEEDIGLGLFD